MPVGILALKGADQDELHGLDMASVLEADLQAAVAGWVGTAQFRIKQQQHARYSKEIAGLMQEYYRTNHVEVNNLIFITYLLLGIIMVAFVVGFAAFGR